jgi:hypothetical protein
VVTAVNNPVTVLLKVDSPVATVVNNLATVANKDLVAKAALEVNNKEDLEDHNKATVPTKEDTEGECCLSFSLFSSMASCLLPGLCCRFGLVEDHCACSPLFTPLVLLLLRSSSVLISFLALFLGFDSSSCSPPCRDSDSFATTLLLCCDDDVHDAVTNQTSTVQLLVKLVDIKVAVKAMADTRNGYHVHQERSSVEVFLSHFFPVDIFLLPSFSFAPPYLPPLLGEEVV